MSEVERDRMRGTGGNLVIGGDATIYDLLQSAREQLLHLRNYAAEDGRTLDLAEVTISTLRTKSGQISVSVSADLTTPRPEPQPEPTPSEQEDK